MKNTVNILMSGNRQYLDAVCIAMLSMAKQTFSRDNNVNVYFLTMDLTDLNPRFDTFDEPCRQFCEKILQRNNPDNKFTVVDCTKIFKDTGLINSANIKTHFSPYTMLRLLADKIDLPSRVVYLDGDVIINGDLAELYNYPLPQGCEIAAVKDLFRIKDYFNAGVLLIDMERCLQTDLFARARTLVIKRRMIYVDQDALNKCVKNRLMLPLKFNAKDVYFPEIVVHHFCNVRRRIFHRVKPWEVEYVKQKMTVYNDLLDEYLSLKPTLYSLKSGRALAD